MFNFTTDTEHVSNVTSFDLQVEGNTQNFTPAAISDGFGGGGVLGGALNTFRKVEKMISVYNEGIKVSYYLSH